MGDALEALIGAIYLDQGFNKTKKFVLERLIKMHLDVNDVMHNDTDFKSQFLNKAQKEKAKAELIVIAESGKGRNKTYAVEARWNGKKLSQSQSVSKKIAEQDAARKALDTMNTL
jgi:ribonuclease-3